MAASAQNWTPDEQSLIDAINYCWDRNADELSTELILEACRPTEATGPPPWPTIGSHPPVGLRCETLSP